jgi:fatty acid CoA ligase FadD9
LTVDFIAGAIVGIGAEAHDEIRTFNVLNSHEDDGISLDSFVDWIRDAGYPVDGVPGYREWLDRFETKLRALPEDKRQHSSLSVIDSLSQPAGNQPMASSRRFQEAVSKLPIGPEVPHLTQEFIFKCLDDMRQLGLIPDPDGNWKLRVEPAAAMS